MLAAYQPEWLNKITAVCRYRFSSRVWLRSWCVSVSSKDNKQGPPQFHLCVFQSSNTDAPLNVIMFGQNRAGAWIAITIGVAANINLSAMGYQNQHTMIGIRILRKISATPTGNFSWP
jgi:hypothetical protein